MAGPLLPRQSHTSHPRGPPTSPGRCWDKHTALRVPFLHLWGSTWLHRALRPCLGSPALLGAAILLIAVTSPVLIILFSPQGAAVKWGQTTDGSLWAWPSLHPQPGLGCRHPGSPGRHQAPVTSPCAAAGEPRPLRAEVRCLWKAAGHRLHPKQHSSPSCPKVLQYCVGLVVF